jgi:hypothetical protein
MIDFTEECNIGCMYFLEWDHHPSEATLKMLWTSNLDKPLEHMEQEEIEETMEYIFNDNFKDIVTDIHDWSMGEFEPYINLGWESLDFGNTYE